MKTLQRALLMILLFGLLSLFCLHYPLDFGTASHRKFVAKFPLLRQQNTHLEFPLDRGDDTGEDDPTAEEPLTDYDADLTTSDSTEDDLWESEDEDAADNPVKDTKLANLSSLVSETKSNKTEPLKPNRDANKFVKSAEIALNPDSLKLDSSKAKSRTAQSRLIILAYMRTGSSMTGNLFNNHPDVFYWFEPLHLMGQLHGQKFSYINKWTKRYRFSSSDEAAGNMTALLNCDISNVFQASLTDGFMSHATATAPFKHCFRNGSRDMLLKHSRTVWDACVKNLTAVCVKNYTVIAAKTIRFRMSRVLEMMQKDPALKVVHLVRDPRGTLESRHRLGFAKYSELEDEALNLCKDVTADLKVAQSMNRTDMKNRYMLVRYEDIAKSPTLAVKLFYDFMGLGLSEKGMKLAEKMARVAPGLRKSCATCEAKASNSTVRSQQWRDVADLKNVQVINGQCSDLMTQLGYRVGFRSEEELQDLRITAVGDPQLKVATSFIQNVREE